jgi:hypothetical protein
LPMAARGIEALCDWLIARTGATPELIGVAIEMTQGPIVERLSDTSAGAAALAGGVRIRRRADRYSRTGRRVPRQ